MDLDLDDLIAQIESNEDMWDGVNSVNPLQM